MDLSGQLKDTRVFVGGKVVVGYYVDSRKKLRRI